MMPERVKLVRELAQVEEAQRALQDTVRQTLDEQEELRRRRESLSEELEQVEGQERVAILRSDRLPA